MVFAFLAWNRVWLQIYGYQIFGVRSEKKSQKSYILRTVRHTPTQNLGSTPLPPATGIKSTFVDIGSETMRFYYTFFCQLSLAPFWLFVYIWKRSTSGDSETNNRQL